MDTNVETNLDANNISGGQKKTRRTLDAYRLKTINAINIIFHTCIAQSVPSNYVNFH